jgi:hypothetical protein
MVGVGPLLLRRRVGEIQFEWRLLPTLGVVFIYPTFVVRRSRQALLLLGGVLGNAAAITLVSVLSTGYQISAAMDDVIGPIVLTQGWLIVVNLMPFMIKVGGRRVGSDGRQLLGLLRVASGTPTDAGKFYALLMATYLQGAAPPSPTPASSRIVYQLARLDRWTDPVAAEEFVAALSRELARNALPPAEEVLVIDGLVTHALVVGDATLRPRLDALTERALALAPLDTLSGSRASALVEIGRHAEGKAMLEVLMAHDELRPFDRFMIEVHLARAEHGLGHREAALRCAAAAHRSGQASQTPATQPLLMRMDAELAAPATGRRFADE